MHITEAAAKLRPGTAWNFRKGEVEQADDGTPRVDAPTKDELDALVLSYDHQESRSKAYPSIGDQLDALWKGGTAQTEMLSKIMAVKEKYPKRG